MRKISSQTELEQIYLTEMIYDHPYRDLPRDPIADKELTDLFITSPYERAAREEAARNAAKKENSINDPEETLSSIEDLIDSNKNNKLNAKECLSRIVGLVNDFIHGRLDYD